MTPGEFWTFLGYATGGLVLTLAARRQRLATDGLRLVALCGVLGGVIGARLTEWTLGAARILSDHPAAFLDPRNGGKSLVGGLFCGWLCVELAKWRLGIKRSTGDLWALALPAGEVVGRIGCLLNGCCFGTAFSGAWSIHQHDAWRHPAQIYSALSAALLFFLLWNLRDKLPREGDLFRLYLLLFGLSRFCIEFYREREMAFGQFSLVQLVCLATALLAAQTLLPVYRKLQKTPAL